MALPEYNAQFSKDTNPWPLDTAVKWIKENMDPEDVFTRDQLEQWAHNNGFQEVEK
jgi:hypothetical protein